LRYISIGHWFLEILKQVQDDLQIDRCIKNDVYQNRIFFFENLGFIEHTDARKISYEDALIFEQIHLDVYKEFGFDIMMVPKGLTVTQRCEFILERVK
jgi:predicted ATPase